MIKTLIFAIKIRYELIYEWLIKKCLKNNQIGSYITTAVRDASP